MHNRRHWADVRKLLEEEFLCDALKGRVRYFNTRYRSAHDHAGCICILVDDQEIISMTSLTEYKVSEEVYKRWPGSGKSRATLSVEVEKDFAIEGVFAPWDFRIALEEFLLNPIEVSLYSENWLIRLFAILDRRTGKRTLNKLKQETHEYPEWLCFFLNLRLESEGMI